MKSKIIFLILLMAIPAFSCRQKATVTEAPQQVSVQPGDSTKLILAKIFLKPEAESEFLSAAKVMVDSARTEKGCLSYTLYQDPFEKTSFIVVELYTNQAAINEHFATHYFKEFGSKAGNLTIKPSEIKIYDIRERKTESFK